MIHSVREFNTGKVREGDVLLEVDRTVGFAERVLSEMRCAPQIQVPRIEIRVTELTFDHCRSRNAQD